MSEQSNTENNKRIAKNTFVLYIRLILTIIIQLYTIPVILRVLGAEGYGLYNVVTGITALFTFLGGSMASGIQRFYSYAIGQNDQEKLKSIFQTTISIFVLIAVIAFLLFEIFGTWFVNYKMIISPQRLWCANWLFQFSIISFIVALITIPYNGIVIAREKMDFYAWISIGSSLLKLLSVFLLQIISYDHLLVYGLLILFIQIIERMAYQTFCTRKFVECSSFKFKLDKKLSLELLAYSGFNIIGLFASILRKQGLNLVMNLFFGTLLNAAHALAIQVNGIVEQFVNNIYTASRPQITKYYAEGNIENMWNLTFRTSLLAYYLFMMIGIISIIEMPTILGLWLHNIPTYTVNIARVFIIFSLMETTINQLSAVFQAYNRIKKWQIYASSVLLFNVPVAYIILKICNTNAMLPYYVQMLFSVIYIIAILMVAKTVINLNLKKYLKHIMLREFLVTILVYVAVTCLTNRIEPSLIRVLFTLVFTIITTISIVLVIGLDNVDRKIVVNFIKKKINK